MQYSKNSNKFLNTASAVSYYINYVLGTSVYDPTKYYAPSEYSGGILFDSTFSPSEIKVLNIVSKAISEHEKSKEILVNRLTSSLITETFVQEAYTADKGKRNEGLRHIQGSSDRQTVIFKNNIQRELPSVAGYRHRACVSSAS